MANQREQVVHALRNLLDRGATPPASLRNTDPITVDLLTRFALLRRRADHAGKTSLFSEHGEAARVATIEAAAAPTNDPIRYVVAVPQHPADPVEKPDDWKEWLWPAANIQPTDIVYDCTEEILHGKAKPILCDLSRFPVRVFAILPTQLEQLRVRATQSVAPKQVLEVHVEFLDAGGHPMRGTLPFHVAVEPELDGAGGVQADQVATRPDDETQRIGDGVGYRVSSPDGTARFQLEITAPTTRRARLVVRSQLNGLTAELPIAWSSNASASNASQKLTERDRQTHWSPSPWQLISADKNSHLPNSQETTR